MKFFRNRAVAVIAALLMILISVVISGNKYLAPMRAETLDVFTEGSDGSGYGIQYDLDKRVELAHNQIVVAKRYLNEDDPLIVAVSDAVDSLSSASTPAEKYDANEQLTVSCQALYDQLSSLTLSAQDSSYNIGILTDLNSHNQIIGHSDYNELAEAFNTMLAKFPTNFVGLVSGVDSLELFE